MREAGQEIKVKKKKFVIEDHFDDCGEDLSSLVGLADCDTSEEESDTAHDEDMRLEIGVTAYPIDPSRVAQPQEGTPAPGRHKDAPEPRASLCPSCRNYRPRDDWEHDRVIGQCS